MHDIMTLTDYLRTRNPCWKACFTGAEWEDYKFDKTMQCWMPDGKKYAISFADISQLTNSSLFTKK